jgi:hypothetical protein
MAQRDVQIEVPRVAWPDHVAAMEDRYGDEDHVSIIAPTRYGKSHLVHHGLLPLLHNDHVLLIDVKGDDPVWNGIPARRVTELPTRMKRKAIEWSNRHNEPDEPPGWYRLVVPEEATRESNRYRIYKALQTCKAEKHWVIVLDETRALTDNQPNGLNLSGAVDSVYLRGGYKQVTFIAATQGPRWVPSTFYEQAHHLYIGQMQDVNAQRRLSEIGGDTQQLISIVAALNRREFLYIGPLGDKGGRVMEIVKVDA